MSEKPPVGVEPSIIYIRKMQMERIVALADAIQRYANAGYPPKLEWAEELLMRTTEVIKAAESQTNRL